MTTITNVQLTAPTVLTVSDAAYYTTPVNQTARIAQCVFSNPTASAVKVTANIVANAGSSSAANQLVNARTLAPGESWRAYPLEGAVLPAGAAVRALCDTAASAVIEMSGATFVG